MIKISSIFFVGFIAVIFLFGIVVSLVPTLTFLNTVIQFSTICLLISGITLILALIIDRFKDSKSEGNDYKKY